jgi:hypothetical protein
VNSNKLLINSHLINGGIISCTEICTEIEFRPIRKLGGKDCALPVLISQLPVVIFDYKLMSKTTLCYRYINQSEAFYGVKSTSWYVGRNRGEL